MQNKARITDALTTEYPDFVDFCVSLDKEYIDELNASDFIAFRTQLGVTRDYVDQIRKKLTSYDQKATVQQKETQRISIEKSSDNTIIDEEKSGIEHATKVNMNDLPICEESMKAEKEKHIESADQSFEVASKTVSIEVENEFGKDTWLSDLEEVNGKNINLPLYDVFGISHDFEYVDINIDELRLSKKAYNCLIDNHCMTYDMLFSHSLLEISKFTYSKKILREIIKRCAYFDDLFDVPYEYIGPSTKLKQKVSKELLTIAELIASEKDYDISGLDETEKDYIPFIEKARKILGSDLSLFALKEAKKARHVQSVLADYIKNEEIESAFKRSLSILSVGNGTFLKLHVLPFVDAAGKKDDNFTKLFTEDDRFSDVLSIVNNLKKEDLNEVYTFKVWLTDLFYYIDGRVIVDDLDRITLIDIDDAYEATIERVKQASTIINYRQEGKTLAEIGDLLGITRESVRQKEKKAIDLFSTYLEEQEVDILAFIHALLDEDPMIHKDEIASFISDNDKLNLLWACIQAGEFDCEQYNYDKYYQAVVFNQQDTNDVNVFVKSLPGQIFADELENIIRHAVDENGLWEEKIRAAIEQRYMLFGTLYSEHRPKVGFICDWILKNRFSSGFKVNDATDSKRFLEYIREIFGENSSHMTARAIDAKVGTVGVLCDRGKYVHPSTISIDPEILDEIDQYIAENPKNAISFIELFEAFKDRLVGTQISNHYFLQGVMKWFGDNGQKRCQYYAFRDYITKDPNVTTTDEFDAFIKEHGIAHKSEIFAEFPALNDATVAQVAMRCPNVFNIDGGYYIHASQFHIQESDYAPLRVYLVEATNELPVNMRKVFDDCSVRFPEFIDRNELHNRDTLFAALNFMFREEFRFNRPYIAKMDDADLTNRGVILSILETYDEIDVDELMDLLDERRIRYISIANLMRLIAPDYIRVDENTLMKRELTGVDDEVVGEALKILKETIDINGYLPSSKVTDFIWYPSIDVTWTPYLLESIVMSSDEIDYIPYSFSRSNRSLVVYVNEKYSHCDYQTLLLCVIDEEYERGTFARKTDMRDWLNEMGLMDAKLPNFLESTQYYYMSDDGRLLRRKEEEQ